MSSQEECQCLPPLVSPLLIIQGAEHPAGITPMCICISKPAWASQMLVQTSKLTWSKLELKLSAVQLLQCGSPGA